MNGFLKKTGIFLQVRINSSRLRGKALLKLFDKTVTEHAMERLNIIPADYRVLLTTKESEYALQNLAVKMGWKIFYGNNHNVLKRFVDAALYYSVDIIVRATADNPLVSSEIAIDTLNLFNKTNCDLAHLTNIPYGSGVEVVKADALVKALENTKIPYDLEHVTPYIYKHRDKFLIKSIPYYDKDTSYENVKISVDTSEDFSRINYLYREIKKSTNKFKIKNIIETWNKLDFKKFKRCLLITAYSDSYGIGHVKKLLNLANKFKDNFHIYLSFKHGSKDILSKIDCCEVTFIEYEKLGKFITDEGNFDRVITDLRDTSIDEMKYYKKLGPVISFDDLGDGGQISDINIKSIPSPEEKNNLKFNLEGLDYLITDIQGSKTNARLKFNSPIKNILVTFGGSDPANFSKPVARILEKLGYKVTLIVGPYFKEEINESENCKIISNIDNLKENIDASDLVITSFGMTFFESLILNKPSILINPSLYHDKLAKDFEYPYVIENNNEDGVIFGLDLKIEELLSKMKNENSFSEDPEVNSLNKFFSLKIGNKKNDMARLINNWTYSIPICQNCSSDRQTILYRNSNYNMHKCNSCGLIYIIPFTQVKQTYNSKYFNQEYREQYGKTYEEDKDNILMFARERLFNIRSYISKGTLLDFGSGLGFFAEYCENNGFITTCLDISDYAVEYINDTLKLRGIKGDTEYLEKNSDAYDVISSYYVIEHIQDFVKLIFLFGSHLRKNGVLSLSTPNANGISIKKDFIKYAKSHPADHYFIISPKLLKQILRKHGFGKIKIIVRGIHIERFIKSEKLKNNKIFSKLMYFYAKLFKLGDTFEIYAQKS